MPYPTTPVPAYQLLVGFGSGELDDNSGWTVDAPGVAPAAGHWTDISGYASSYRVKRGRQPQTGLVEAGTLSVRLRSDDGEFATWGQAGLFSTFLDVARQVQVRVTVAGVVYYRFTGSVTRWAQQWGQVTNEVELQAADRFRVLNRTLLATGAYEAAVRAVAAHWWRFNELPEAVEGADSVGSAPMLMSNPRPTFGGPPLVNASPGAGSVDLGGYVSTDVAPPPVQPYLTTTGGPSGFTWAVGAWVSGIQPGQQQTLFGQWGSASRPAYQVRSLYGAVYATILGPSSQGSISSTIRIADGQPHLIVLTRANGVYTLFVDGVSAGTYGLSGSLDAVANVLTVGGSLYGRYAAGGGAQTQPDMAGGMIAAEVFVATQAVTAAQVAELASLGFGYPLQTVDERIGAVLDTVGVPGAGRRLDRSVQAAQRNAVDLTKTSALAHIQQAAQTEEGSCFADRAGAVQLLSRRTIAEQAPYAAAQATFGDRFNRPAQTPATASTWGAALWDAGSWTSPQTAAWGSATWDGSTAWGVDDLPYDAGADIGIDDQDVVTEPDVTRIGGTLQSVYGRNSYGPRGLARTGMLHLTDAASLEHARWLLGKFSTTSTRVRSLRTDLTDYLHDGDALGRVLGLDLLHGVNVNRSQVGFYQRSNIDGYEEDASAEAWSVTFHMSNSEANPDWDWAGAQ